MSKHDPQKVSSEDQLAGLTQNLSFLWEPKNTTKNSWLIEEVKFPHAYATDYYVVYKKIFYTNPKKRNH